MIAVMSISHITWYLGMQTDGEYVVIRQPSSSTDWNWTDLNTV